MDTNYTDKTNKQHSYFTFGQGQAHHISGITFDPDCMVEVLADDPRRAMFSIFGEEWGFEYSEPVKPHFAKRGIVAKIIEESGAYILYPK